MKIKEMLKIERPREKLIHYGPDRLKDIELLAILLGSGRRGENVIELAKRAQKVINKFDGNVSIDDFIGIKGIGKIKACQLVAMIEYGKRFLKGKQQQLIMKPKDVWEAMADVRDSKKEHFVVFYLDVKNQLIQRELISLGTLNASLVHPREVFEPAVKYSTAQIIISHNHPSEDSNPSSEDIEMTKKLIKAGEILGIEIIDHVIVTKLSYLSLKQKGYI